MARRSTAPRYSEGARSQLPYGYTGPAMFQQLYQAGLSSGHYGPATSFSDLRAKALITQQRMMLDQQLERIDRLATMPIGARGSGGAKAMTPNFRPGSAQWLRAGNSLYKPDFAGMVSQGYAVMDRIDEEAQRLVALRRLTDDLADTTEQWLKFGGRMSTLEMLWGYDPRAVLRAYSTAPSGLSELEAYEYAWSTAGRPSRDLQPLHLLGPGGMRGGMEPTRGVRNKGELLAIKARNELRRQALKQMAQVRQDMIRVTFRHFNATAREAGTLTIRSFADAEAMLAERQDLGDWSAALDFKGSLKAVQQDQDRVRRELGQAGEIAIGVLRKDLRGLERDAGMRVGQARVAMGSLTALGPGDSRPLGPVGPSSVRYGKSARPFSAAGIGGGMRVSGDFSQAVAALAYQFIQGGEMPGNIIKGNHGSNVARVLEACIRRYTPVGPARQASLKAAGGFDRMQRPMGGALGDISGQDVAAYASAGGPDYVGPGGGISTKRFYEVRQARAAAELAAVLKGVQAEQRKVARGKLNKSAFSSTLSSIGMKMRMGRDFSDIGSLKTLNEAGREVVRPHDPIQSLMRKHRPVQYQIKGALSGKLADSIAASYQEVGGYAEIAATSTSPYAWFVEQGFYSNAGFTKWLPVPANSAMAKLPFLRLIDEGNKMIPLGQLGWYPYFQSIYQARQGAISAYKMGDNGAAGSWANFEDYMLEEAMGIVFRDRTGASAKTQPRGEFVGGGGGKLASGRNTFGFVPGHHMFERGMADFMQEVSRNARRIQSKRAAARAPRAGKVTVKKVGKKK